MSRRIEDEIEGGDEGLEQGALPTPPDPKGAKVTELNAYCKAVGDWPEGWKELKAPEKRVAFRRHFFGEATSTFDPNDPLHLISEEVERMTPEQLASAVSGAGEAVGFDYFKLGGALARINEGPYESDFGCATFKDWLAKHTDLTYGKARNLMRCYVKLVELEVAWPRICDIGWTKVRMMVDVLDAESLDGWLEKAKAMGKRELADEVKAAKRGDKVAAEGTSTTSTKRVSFELHPEQLEVVEEALKEMAERSGNEHRAVCLEYICGEYLSGQDGVPEAKADDAPKPVKLAPTFEVGQEQLNELVARLVELSGQDEAIDALCEVWEVRFPDVDIEVKA